MRIAYMQRTSLIDYPGKISAIVFTQGCNFRCPYCHNPELVDPELFTEPMKTGEILDFFEKRKGKLDACVITGGEPCLQKDLILFIKDIKDAGFLVKLDTNGSMPDVVEACLDRGLVDYIAMDIKAPLDKYSQVAGVKVDTDAIEKSIRLIKEACPSYEFRTTIVKELLTPNDIVKIGETIRGARLYILQKFVPSKTLDKAYLGMETYSDTELDDLKSRLSRLVEACMVR